MFQYINDHNAFVSNDLIKHELYEKFVITSSEGFAYEPWRSDHISRASQYSDFLSELGNITYPEIARSFLADVYEDITGGDEDFDYDNNINDLIYSIIALPWTILYPDYFSIGGWTENRMGYYTCADYIRDMEIKRRDTSEIEHIDMYQFIPYNSIKRRPISVKGYDTMTSDFSTEEFELKNVKTETANNHYGRRSSRKWR